MLIENDNKSQILDLNENDININILGTPKGFYNEEKDNNDKLLVSLLENMENKFERKKSASGIPNENVKLKLIIR